MIVLLPTLEISISLSASKFAYTVKKMGSYENVFSNEHENQVKL